VAAADDGHVVLAMTDRPLRSVRRRAQSRSPPRGRRKLLLRGGARVACTRTGVQATASAIP